MEDKKKAVMNGELTEQDVAETNAKLDSEKLDGVSGGYLFSESDNKAVLLYQEENSSELRGSMEQKLELLKNND
ncbi:MAG: hypothetical protein BZ136_08385 [Methanosphaera sp. rholeuAM74]|nr:MAG: hypothetical protein BZ136_08385 [Methanosphaera sp. rholeuAM74]